MSTRCQIEFVCNSKYQGKREKESILIYRHSDGRFAFSFHYYDGEDEGKARLAVREIHWNESWPVLSRTNYFKKTQ